MPIETPEWVRDAVFYQIFPDRFARSGRVAAPGRLEPWEDPPTVHGFKGGDLPGIADRLDYLADLGITALYLNPVFASASNHRYHTYDYFTVDPLLGGNEGLRDLLDRAHARGIRVVLDGVFNHASRGFWAFHHVLECGLGSPYLDWFHVDRGLLEAGRSLRAYPDETLRHALEELGGVRHFGAETFTTLGYRAWWNLPALPKFNTDNPVVRDYLMGIAEHWIRFGVDGWRLDVAAEIDDDDFWREFRRRVKAANPEAYIVAEIWHEDHRWLRGDQFDAYMNYPFGFAALSFGAGRHRDERELAAHGELQQGIRRDDGPAFAERLTHALTTYDPAINAVQLNLLGSHDLPRIRTICGGDGDAIRLATLVQMTVGGAPCVYYGDELGLLGGHDPHCRGSFPVAGAAHDPAFHAFFRGVIGLRHAHAALRRGEFAFVGADGPAAAYLRRDAEATFVVALNNADEPSGLAIRLPGAGAATLAPVAPDGWPWPATAPIALEAGCAELRIPARGALLLRVA